MTDDKQLKNYLTQEEVNRLPNKTRVMVLWSGGNGPHEYIIFNGSEDWDECAYALSLRQDLPQDPRRNPLNFVGKESFHTKVYVIQE